MSLRHYMIETTALRACSGKPAFQESRKDGELHFQCKNMRLVTCEACRNTKEFIMDTLVTSGI